MPRRLARLVAFAHHVVHQDAVLRKLIHAAEQLVGQQLYVGTQAQQKRGHHDAVQHAKGMIGEDHGGAFQRHMLEVSLAHRVLNIHLAQDAVEDVSIRVGQGSGIDAIQAADGEKGTRPGNLLPELWQTELRSSLSWSTRGIMFQSCPRLLAGS